jgi:hypothetical protein
MKHINKKSRRYKPAVKLLKTPDFVFYNSKELREPVMTFKIIRSEDLQRRMICYLFSF